ncbi:hypothetical protein FYK55_12405 [Roseiconus nitratireducens]|uniref:Glycoside hydrolase family 2 catalytic domain-containing protein n=1 Tax=Roseiconus nitratireducens TaxID=2605748 RepID=A0A5M6DD33_9BACT|nr:sugar-binding domain-containing protein [Roseiconus nitratireducens]KAA5543085.1 hypothetical protein FYK55_12405 [Roseiconus nitratireducens]
MQVFQKRTQPVAESTSTTVAAILPTLFSSAFMSILSRHWLLALLLLMHVGRDVSCSGQGRSATQSASPQSPAAPQADASSTRWSQELDADWRIDPVAPSEAQGGTAFNQPIPVPSAWEHTLGKSFDGSAVYQLEISEQTTRRVQAELQRRSRSVPQQLFIVFDGVATEAIVRCNQIPVGEHLGAWTRWSCNLDQAWDPEGPNRIEVRVDEKVGHHTQGFLPVFAPHFGGIWQPVRLEIRPQQRIDTENTLVLGRYRVEENHRLALRVALQGPLPEDAELDVVVDHPRRKLPNGSWQSARKTKVLRRTFALDSDNQSEEGFEFDIPLKDARAWSPESPWLYDVRLSLTGRGVAPDAPVTAGERDPDAGTGGQASAASTRVVYDSQAYRTGIRLIETRGDQLFLNGRPIIVRGLLNWGYAPPSTAPSLDDRDMRDEIACAQRMGLNLMKFCLWIPPRRYLELADEEGLLAWVEYPTWHAKLVESNLAELQREYLEFTHHDRNHPCVVLRSLTCETGPSASLEVIESLYRLVHRQVPDAIVEDDSSWISWNRISDIWDDHPYGNNHTWPEKLGELRQFIAEREAKPLLLGEAIAADTWPDLNAIRNQMDRQTAERSANRKASERSQSDANSHVELPFWVLNAYESAKNFEDQLAEHSSPDVVMQMRQDSLDYAYQMRKYQIETYRREIPWGGFVVSVIRDFPFAPMGVIDSTGAFKFSEWGREAEWSADDPMLLLKTQDDRRSFIAGTTASVDWLMANAKASQLALQRSTAKQRFEVRWRLLTDRTETPVATGNVLLRPPSNSAPKASAADHFQATAELSFPISKRRRRMELVGEIWAGRQRVATNRWPIWVLPPAQKVPQSRVQVHAALEESRKDWMHAVVAANQNDAPSAATFESADAHGEPGVQAPSSILVASRFDNDILDQLQSGRSVLLLPDGGPGSFPVRDHWFLRGGPVVFPDRIEGSQTTRDDHSLTQLLVDLQHFDLAGSIQPDFDFWQETDPWLILWDSHDLDHVKTHGLLWGARVGAGRLIVSTLNHDPERSAAGPHVLRQLLHRLIEEPLGLRGRLSEETQSRLRSSLNLRQINLAQAEWKLKVDSDSRGFQARWFEDREAGEDPFADASSIRIDSHWDGQGHGDLDGWAWYSTEVSIPNDWKSDDFYLCFTGVDDHYQAFVNGRKIGQAGNIDRKETAFEMRSSHRLPDTVKAGDRLRIRIAVYDWYGAGGIFRPVFLRTTPLPAGSPLLRE